MTELEQRKQELGEQLAAFYARLEAGDAVDRDVHQAAIDAYTEVSNAVAAEQAAARIAEHTTAESFDQALGHDGTAETHAEYLADHGIEPR